MVDPKGVNLLVMAMVDEESEIDSCFIGGGGGRVAGSLLWLLLPVILPLQKFSC